MMKNLKNTSSTPTYIEHQLSVELLHELTISFRDFIDPSVVSARLVQTEEAVYLDVVRPDPSFNESTIKRNNLDFIYNNKEPRFSQEKPITQNVKNFLELDIITLHYCTEGLFVSELNLDLLEK